MNSKYLLATLALGAVAWLVPACKRHQEAPAPKAAFTLSDSVFREGDTILVNNVSEHAVRYRWYLNGTLFSESAAPYWIPELNGTYNLELHAISQEGAHHVAGKQLRVLPDTVWRLSEHGSKSWTAVSLLYAGNEMIQFPCQKDDIVTFSYGPVNDYSFTEGKDTCPSGTYLIPMPQKGSWRYDAKRKELNCAVTEPAPLLLTFKFDSLSRNYFKGTDSRNDAVLILKH